MNFLKAHSWSKMNTASWQTSRFPLTEFNFSKILVINARKYFWKFLYILLCTSESPTLFENLAKSHFSSCCAHGKFLQLFDFRLAAVIHMTGGLGTKLPQ